MSYNLGPLDEPPTPRGTSPIMLAGCWHRNSSPKLVVDNLATGT